MKKKLIFEEKRGFFKTIGQKKVGIKLKNLFHSNFNPHVNKPIKSHKFKRCLKKWGLDNEVFNITLINDITSPH